MPLTSPGNDDDTGENHQPTLRKNTAEPVEQTLKQNTDRTVTAQSARDAQAAAELKRLRAEVAELRKANEILTTASAFFAARLDPTRR